MAEVVSIHVVRNRAGVAEALDRVNVRMNYGIEGDWRSRHNGAGQVTLIEAEALEEVERRLGYPVPAGASRRQIVVRGIRLTDLLWQHIYVGPVHLFVEDHCKPCRRMEETVGDGARHAMEGCGGVRCLVLEGGELCIGAGVSTEPLPRPTPTPA
jgi:MOSC domain-containing protein YiiM